MLRRADLELVAWLNAIDGNVPIIVLSGWNGQSYVDEAQAAGAREYLTKPCALGDIEATVQRALGFREARQFVNDAARLPSAGRAAASFPR